MTNNDLSTLPGPFAAASADRAGLDYAKYAPMIADFEISEAQGRELLEALWSIMCAMVEMGFTVDICAQIFETPDPGAEPSGQGVNFPHPSTTET